MIKIYNDLLIEINAYQEQLEFAEDTKKRLLKLLNIRSPHSIKAMAFDNIGHSSRDDTTTDRTFARLYYTDARIDTYTSILEGLQQQKDKVQADLSKLEGLQYKIYFMHIVEGMTLQEISEELGKSPEHIRDINSQIGKMLKNDK